MTRRSFVLLIWKKFLMPLLLVIAIFFSLKFIYYTLLYNEPGRYVILLIFGLSILSIIAQLITLFFQKAIKKMDPTYLELLRSTVRIVLNIIDYSSPITFAIASFYLWRAEWFSQAVILGILALQRISALVDRQAKVRS